MQQVWTLPEPYNGWIERLAVLEDHDDGSPLYELEYRYIDKSDPNADAVVRLKSGRLVGIREYNSTGPVGSYELFRFAPEDSPEASLAEFLEESGISPTKVLWTEFDGWRRRPSNL